MTDSGALVVRGRLVQPSAVVDDGVVVASGGRVTFAGSVSDALATGYGPAVENETPPRRWRVCWNTVATAPPPCSHRS